MLGMHGSACANYAVQEADLIIALGARFDDRVTGRVADFAPKAREAAATGTGGFIHFEIEQSMLDKVVPATVPVLVTDEGDTLTENLGIAAYLEARFPNPPLLGATPSEKGAVAMWNATVEFHGGMPIAETLRNSNPHMKDRAIPGQANYAQIPELAERGRARVATFFQMLEHRLTQTPYIAGDFFSLADISTFVFVDFARVIKERIPENNAATRAWFDRIKARPSASL